MVKRDIASLSEERMNSNLKEHMNCSFEKASASLLSSSDPDPRNSADVIQAFGNNGSNSSAAAISWLLSQGFAGAGVVTVAGADYHNQAVDGPVRNVDRTLGQRCGQYMRLHAELGLPCVAVFTSDGSAASRPGSTEGNGGFAQPRADSRNVCSTCFFVYSPNKAPELKRVPRLGGYRGDSVDTSFAVSSREGAQCAVILNYLALIGEEGRYLQVLADHGIANALGPNWQNEIVFGSIV